MVESLGWINRTANSELLPTVDHVALSLVPRSGPITQYIWLVRALARPIFASIN